MSISSPNLMDLDRKAIKAALDTNWKNAVDINSQILEVNPSDIKAKIRLGKAFLELRDFQKAKKQFSDVLKNDPINKVARKNLKLAIDKKTKNSIPSSTKSLIIEPGTTLEDTFLCEAKNISSDDFAPAEKLGVKYNKKSANIYKISTASGSKSTFIGKVGPKTVKRLNNARAKKTNISAFFVSGNGKKIKMIFKADFPVFKSERQEVKPYMKRESIEIK